MDAAFVAIYIRHIRNTYILHIRYANVFRTFCVCNNMIPYVYNKSRIRYTEDGKLF